MSLPGQTNTELLNVAAVLTAVIILRVHHNSQ